MATKTQAELVQLALVPGALEKVRQYYGKLKKQPVDVGGIFWKGGFESAQAINGLAQMLEHSGGGSSTLHDVDGNSYTKTVTEMKDIALSIGMQYQVYYTQEVSAEKALREAQTKEDVEAVLSNLV